MFNLKVCPEGREFCYVLRDILGANQGEIICTYNETLNILEIVIFYVERRYRGDDKHRYGSQLFDAVLKEAKQCDVFPRIVVIPIPFVRYDDEEPMTVEELVKKYERMLFKHFEKDSPQMMYVGGNKSV